MIDDEYDEYYDEVHEEIEVDDVYEDDCIERARDMQEAFTRLH